MAPIGFLLPNIDRVEQLVETYRDKVTNLVDTAIRPKVHYLMHIPRSIRQMAANVNCFSPERRHKQVKQIVCHCFGTARVGPNDALPAPHAPPRNSRTPEGPRRTPGG
eukprot:5724511-Pyramimonas_sp.AAC.1